MKICIVVGCDNLIKNNLSGFCAMHETRVRRNGYISLKKEVDISHGLEILPHDIVDDIIRDNMDKKDKEIVNILIEEGFKEASLRNVKYRRKRLGLKKYKFDGKHYSIKLAKEKYGQSCELCSYSLTIDVHHILEKKKGGTDEIENLCVLCPNCHSLIHRNILSPMKSRDDISQLILELKELTN